MSRALRVAAALLVAALGCSSSGDGKAAPTTEPAAQFSLPAGPLRERVLQPGDVSRALVPIAAQTGARDIAAIAAFSSDVEGAKRSLQAHGFQTAYVVQYGDPANSATVTNVVTKFATVEGATADLTADIAAAAKTGTVVDVSGLGDQAGGVKGKLDANAAEGTLVTLRWRVGDTTWLLAVGSPKQVDVESVRKLAGKLAGR